MNSNVSQTQESLYERDFMLWVDQTVENLQTKNVEQLDWEHLIEEVEALGKEQKNKVDSYLLQLLIHLLIYQYWQTEREWSGKGWAREIDDFRIQLELFFESTTLYNYCLQRIKIIYEKARKIAIRKSELSPEIFPDYCPFSVEELLDFDFFPE